MKDWTFRETLLSLDSRPRAPNAELSDPGVFGKAAAAAILAEVIVIAVPAARELPPGLRAWIDAWMPHRHRREGALMAVLGVSGEPGALSNHAQEYLGAIARQGGLDLLLQEHLAGKASPPAVSRRT